MAGMTNKTIAATYKGLLKTAGDNVAVPTGSIGVNVVDGEENVTPLWLTDGEVGIGTSKPVQLLDVSTVNGSPTLGIGVRRQTSSTDSIAASAVMGTIYFGAHQSSTNAKVDCARIHAESDADWTDSSDYPGKLVFSTVADGATAQSERMTIKADGKVGIGTDSPSAPLSVKSSGTSSVVQSYIKSSDTNHIIEFEEGGASQGIIEVKNASGGTAKIRLDGAGDTWFNGGNVGIGTASPFNTLQISHAAADSDNGLMIVNEATTVADAVLLGAIGFDSADGNVPSSCLEASCFIAGYSAQAHHSTEKGGDLIFGCSLIDENHNVTSTEHMRIEANGNVGIGTDSPDYLLDVEASGDSTARIYTTTGSTDAVLRLQNSDRAWQAFVDGNDAEKFKIRDITASSADRLTITSSGNVGIGTTAPDMPLNVSATTGFVGINSTGSNNSGIEWAQGTAPGTSKWQMYNVGGGSHNIKMVPAGAGAGCEIAQDGTTWTGISDERIKENITNIDVGLDCVLAMRPIRFKYKEILGGADGIGFIAQEMKLVLPDIVYGEEDDWKIIPAISDELDDDGNVIKHGMPEESINHLTVGQTEMIPVLVKAIQELSAKVTALENA